MLEVKQIELSNRIKKILDAKNEKSNLKERTTKLKYLGQMTKF